MAWNMVGHKYGKLMVTCSNKFVINASKTDVQIMGVQQKKYASIIVTRAKLLRPGPIYTRPNDKTIVNDSLLSCR